MELILQQNRPLSYRKFTLSDKTVQVESRTIREKKKYEVKLENLGLDITYEADDVRVGKIFLSITVISLIAVPILYFAGVIDSFITIFYIITCGILSLGNYFKPHKDDIVLAGGQQKLEFHRNFPSEPDVLNFAEEVKSRVKKTLRDKYSSYNSTTSKDQYYRCLNWLLGKDIINFAELEMLKNEFDLWYNQEHFGDFIAN